MPANVLVLPFLAGFWFIHFCHYFRYRAKGLDGTRIGIESAIAGAFLFLLARVCTYGATRFVFGARLGTLWKEFAPVEFSGTAALAFVLGLVLPFLVNIFFGQEKALRKAVSIHGSGLLRLLHEASYRDRPVSISLDSRKAYIGYVLGAPNLYPHSTHVEFLPMISGYRDKDTLELRLTTDYSKVYQLPEGDPSRFLLTFPLSAITTCNYFDPLLTPAFEIEQEEDSLTESGPT
jgi:hypothetical protein